MSSSSTLAVLSTSSASMQHELSDEENLANTPTIQNGEESETKIEDEDSNLSTDDELDVELGTATFMPMRRAPVRRVNITRRKTAPARSQHRINEKARPSKTAPATPARVTTPHPVSERAVKKADTPPPPIPERSWRRAAPLQPLALERDTRRDGVVLPPLPSALSIDRPRTPSPPALKCTILSIPAEFSEEVEIVFAAPPKRQVTILSPVPQRCTMDREMMASLTSAYSGSVYSLDSRLDSGFDWVAMHCLYEEHLAGRLVFPPSPEPMPLTEAQMEEEDHDEMEVFASQKRIFETVAPGRGMTEFRSPFVELGMSASDMDDILSMFPAPLTNERKVSEESIRRAVYDESILGSSSTSNICPGDTRLTRAEATSKSMPEGRLQQYDFIAADSWLLDGDDNGEEEQDEIVNPYDDEFTFSGKGWTAIEGEISLSGSSSVLATSRLPSPFPHNRSTEAMLYSPAENPFHSDEDFNSIDDPMEDWLESPEFFAGLDIEALVADAQDTGSELQDTDKEKGDPKVLKLAPHSPRKACGCFHCEEHNRPSRPSEMEHDPSQWCYCFNCRIFREKASNAAFWKAHFDKLDADFEEAKAEEKRRKADLPKSKTLDASKVEDSSKPKKACKLGHWVRRHLACSSSGE